MPYSTQNDDSASRPRRDEVGHTTSDLQSDAQEAVDRLNAMQNRSDDETSDMKTGYFDRHMLLWLEIEGSARPIALSPSRQMLIGRHDPMTGTVPEIDLAPYAGYQKGISRRHASIRWEDQQLFLVDLSSRNGTYLNGKRVDPLGPLKLHDGDTIRVGKITLRVSFRENPNSAAR